MPGDYFDNLWSPCHEQRAPLQSRQTSKSFTDYMTTNKLNAETFETHVSDSPFRISKTKPIDYRDTSNIGNFPTNTKKLLPVKKSSTKNTGKIFFVGIWNPATGAGLIAKIDRRSIISNQ